jgi:hypothetical protein
VGKDDPLNSLRKYRPPLWARIIGWARARCRMQAERSRWRLIASVNHWTWWTDTLHWDHNTYVCFQRGDGRRKYEHLTTSGLLECREKRNDTYIQIVVPWLHGNYSNEQLVRVGQATSRKPEKIPS